MDADYNITLKGKGMNKYPAKTHALRVAKALGEDKGLILIQGTPSETWPNSDMNRPFRQDRYFYYLTGCNEPSCYVTYDIALDTLTLWLPPINKARVVWTGRGSTVEEALQRYDIDAAHYIEHKEICTRSWTPSEVKDRTRYDTRGKGNGQVYSLCRGPGHSEDEYEREKSLKQAFDQCRVIKDEYEIDMMRVANEISGEAHAAVLRNLSGFSGEPDVEAQYMQVCIANRAKEQAYDPIAGAGTNASELHYMKNDASFDRYTQLLVLDAGCEVGCYASDVTRTMPINLRNPGYWPSKEAENTYKLVERVQKACIEQMQPGNTFVEVHRLAQNMIVDGLMDLGILKGKRADIVKASVVLGFFPHGLGHHMGLEVHDVSPQAPPSRDADASTLAFDPKTCRSPCIERAPIMKPGMVITVEPGVYFNRFLLEEFYLNDPLKSKFIDEDVLSRYMSVGGVRIEDDILITKDGYENLTTAPKGERMLEIIRSGARGTHRSS